MMHKNRDYIYTIVTAFIENVTVLEQWSSWQYFWQIKFNEFRISKSCPRIRRIVSNRGYI